MRRSLALVVVAPFLLPARSPSTSAAPKLGWPRLDIVQRVLTEAAPRTLVEVSVPVLELPGRAAQYAVLHVVVREAISQKELATLSSQPVRVTAPAPLVLTVTVDAAALKLASGSYTVQGAVVLGATDAARRSFVSILQSLRKGGGDFAVMFTKEQGVLYYGRDPRAVAAYQAAIDSGNPTLVHRGLSQLMMHHRVRGDHAAAVSAVLTTQKRYGKTPEVAKLAPLFTHWRADEHLQAGDTRSARAILEGLLLTAPRDAGMLGQPLRAQTLLALADVARQQGDFKSALDYADQVVSAFPERAISLDARHTAGLLALELRDWKGARERFYQLIKRYDDCLGDKAPAAPCPERSQALSAKRLLDVLDSDRRWYRTSSDDVVKAVATAVELRDVELLASLVSAVDMKAGLTGGEMRPTRWEAIRPIVERVFKEAPELVVTATPARANLARRYVQLTGFAKVPELPATLLIEIDDDWFGSQVGGIGVVLRLPQDDLGDFDPEPWEPPFPPNPPNPPNPPDTNYRSIDLSAPWAPGEAMRAGGLGFEVDWDEFGDSGEAVLQALGTAILRFDACGPGVPGYYYQTGPTHQEEDAFAIDFMDGYGALTCFNSYIFGRICIPDPSGPIQSVAEILEGIVRLATGGVDRTAAAYMDPVMAAAPGLVVRVVDQHSDGSTSTPNAVDVAAWARNEYPQSALAFLTGSGSPVDIGTTSNLGAALALVQPHFFYRQLHLSREGQPPSRGMWVNRGQLLGYMDDTGESFTSHLHFVLRARPADPAQWSNSNAWRSQRPRIENRFMVQENNGDCIRSNNELVILDTDNDGIPNADDNCMTAANPQQQDVNGDGIGDYCTDDFDNDGTLNEDDTCPYQPSGSYVYCLHNGGCIYVADDFDNDGTANPCDDDRDGDGVPNGNDRCEYFDDAFDMDGDGTPDPCDHDQDGDNWDDMCERPHQACGCVPDTAPSDPTRAGDYDGDGIDSMADDCPCHRFICLAAPADTFTFMMNVTEDGLTSHFDAPILVAP